MKTTEKIVGQTNDLQMPQMKFQCKMIETEEGAGGCPKVNKCPY